MAALAVTFALDRPALGVPCDAAYVQVSHKFISVSPTGGEDTANLQCAFDYGATLGPGVTIQLAAGTFHTAQLIVQGLRGTIRGMGQERSTIHNLNTPLPIDRPDCTGPGPCFADAPPAPDNRYPTLISVIGTDVRLADVRVDIVGTHVTEVWTMWGFKIDGFSEIIQFIGSHASLQITHATITGPAILPDEAGTFGGATTSILMWSFSRPWFVTDSTMAVTDCTLTGANAFNIDHSRATIARNRFELGDYQSATVVSDARNSQVMFEHNVVVANGSGFGGSPGNIGTGIRDTHLFIDNNVFSGDIGIQFLPGSFHDVACLAVNNDMSQVANPYVWDNSTPCRVVGGGPKP